MEGDVLSYKGLVYSLTRCDIERYCDFKNPKTSERLIHLVKNGLVAELKEIPPEGIIIQPKLKSEQFVEAICLASKNRCYDLLTVYHFGNSTIFVFGEMRRTHSGPISLKDANTYDEAYYLIDNTEKPIKSVLELTRNGADHRSVASEERQSIAKTMSKNHRGNHDKYNDSSKIQQSLH